MNHQKILVLDYGSQVTQLIARRIREQNVYCEIHPGDVSPAFIRDFGARGIILSGSHLSAYDADAIPVAPVVFELGVPVLGICYGMQAMATSAGKCRAATIASSAPPPFAPGATPGCSTAFRTARTTKVTACWTCG